MESILAGLADPFERMTEAEASALLAEHYGLEPSGLERLDTERDDSWRVATGNGDFVLKVAHPADDALAIGLQIEAPFRAALVDPSLPVQRVLPSRHGELVPHWHGRAARLLSWLPGELLALHQPTDEQLALCGATLGRLSRALRDFEHPAAGCELAWDLQRLPRLRPFAHDPLTLGVIERFERVVAPALAALPHQVIHNDFHPGNVLVDAADPRYVVGVLDFGDVVHTARVCDLGVALAYLVPSEGPVWAAAQPFLDGFESEVPLLDAERVVLPDLVAARLVQRILIPEQLAHGRDDIMHAMDANTRLLRNLLSEG
jgi:hydroxylysine kinase